MRAMTGSRYPWAMTLLELLCALLCELWWTSRPAQLLLLCGAVIVIALFLALLLAGVYGAAPQQAW